MTSTPMDIDPLPFDSYPTEIFDRIAYYLTTKQNGICRSVCRSWSKLFTPSQYRHIQIRGRRQFEHIYHSLEHGTVGHYVRRLSVEDVDMASQELESLPVLCPNLVAFSFNGKHKSNAAAFAEWKHLRRLTELQDLTVTNYLLSGPLSSLTHLSIRLDGNKQEFLASLSKATELVNLSLDSATLSLADIEAIHQSCPYLQKLRLINATLEPIASTVEAKRQVASWNISPAKFMTTFEYENGSDLYDNYEWLYYWSIKYPSLENLELWCAYSVCDPPERTLLTPFDLEERYGALASIGMYCRNIKSLKLLNVTMNHWIFEVMDRVGTQLQHLGLSDMTDETIDVLQYLGESNVNISSLTLWGWSTLCISQTMEETINAIGNCSDKLTNLTLSMQFSGIMNAPVYLDLLLDQCPHLTYLKLDSAQPCIRDTLDIARESLVNDGGSFVRPRLQHLCLDHGSFRNDLFEYIALRCPNLTKLDIDSCALIAPGFSDFQLQIHMPLHRFERLSINHVRPPSNYHHAKKASDIRFFKVNTVEWHQLYELADYEPYTQSLAFNYEQKPEETTRPTNYIIHDDMTEVSPTTFVSVDCLHLNELNIGDFWVH